MVKPKENKILEHRMTTQEVLMREVREDIRGIKENHLEKIYTKLDEIKEQYNKRPGWLISGLVAICTGLIVYLVTH